MRVYRLETKEGYGPLFLPYQFVTDDDIEKISAIANSHIDLSEHPIPEEDGLGKVTPNECCGCTSLRQLYEWFPTHIRYQLAEFGFRVAMYEVRQARIGARQCAFIKPTDLFSSLLS